MTRVETRAAGAQTAHRPGASDRQNLNCDADAGNHDAHIRVFQLDGAVARGLQTGL